MNTKSYFRRVALIPVALMSLSAKANSCDTIATNSMHQDKNALIFKMNTDAELGEWACEKLQNSRGFKEVQTSEVNALKNGQPKQEKQLNDIQKELQKQNKKIDDMALSLEQLIRLITQQQQ